MKKRRNPTAEARKERASGPRTVAKKPAKPAKKLRKRPTNLTLDPEAIARGERFGKRHGTSLSQLVNRFLNSLPVREKKGPAAELTPAVRRLYGVARGGRADRDAHRAHLLRKYGGRG